MKTIKTLLSFLTALIVLSSCGLMEMDDEQQQVVSPVSMRLNRDTVYVMRDETFSLSALYTPDEVSEKVLYWQVEDEDIVRIEDNSFRAIEEGWTIVTAQNLFHPQLVDTCHVCVTPRWTDPLCVFPYETIIYASTSIKGIDYNPETMVVAAYVSDQLRGIAKLMEWGGKSYLCIRVGSYIYDYDNPVDEVIHFRLYNKEDLTVRYLTTSIDFDGETHGSLSTPMTLSAK